MVHNIEHLNLIVFPLLLFLIFLYKWLFPKPPQKNQLPSPPKLPILGNLHQLGMFPHRSFRALSEKYGDLMLIHLGPTPFLVVSSVKGARDVMKTHDVVFANRPNTQTIEKLLYDCKDVGAAQYGEYWRQMKSICVLQLLSNKRVRSFRSVREEETALLMENITKSSSPLMGNSSVNLTELFVTFTKDVICRVAFGRKYRGTEGGTDFQKLLGEFLELIGGFRIGDFIPWLSWVNRIDGWDKRIQRVTKEFDQFLEDVLRQHQDNVATKAEDDEVKDFVDVLLQVQKEKPAGFPIGRDSIKALMLDMFSGGMDTTFTVLEWAMAEVLRHPKVMQELQKEVRQIIGEKSHVNEDDLDQMKYLKAVLKETLRLHPPIPYLGRLSTSDVKINGYDIPAGTSVLTNIWAIQRDPSYWEEPDRFNPERFLRPNSVDFKGQDFELTPFGAGRRMCPGISFALVMEELVLANVMLKFDWALPGGMKDEDLDMSECTGITTHKKTPLLAVATPHNVM